jgi:XRE family transcriptional regulator, regulator of sulfur utilization
VAVKTTQPALISSFVAKLLDSEHPELALDELGERVRRLRLAQRATLNDLARTARVSSSMLSDVERGAKAPTVLVLDRIATALGTTLARLLSDERAARVIPLPAARQDVARDPSGWERRILSPVVPGFEFEMMRTTLPPGVDAGEFPPHPHGSHSYLAVAEGRLRLSLDGAVHDLAAGDAIYYAADCRHGFANPHRRACVYYLANCFGPARAGAAL